LLPFLAAPASSKGSKPLLSSGTSGCTPFGCAP
jgi:hypothetical protein